MMRVLRRCIALLVLTGVLTAAPAGAQRPHEPLSSNPVVLPAGDYCAGFTVVITFPVMNQHIIRRTTAGGVTTLKITGHAEATVTNHSTGESINLNISGPGTLVIYPDGAFSIDAHGPNLLWTTMANSLPGVPTLSYTTGHVRVQVNASGQTTAYDLSGRQMDICAVLAT